MALQRWQDVQSPCGERGHGVSKGQKKAPVAENVE